MAQMSPEQRATAERGIEMQKKFAGIGYYAFALVGPILGGLLASGVLTAIVAGILSAGVKFKQVLAIFFYSGVPSIIWALLAIVDAPTQDAGGSEPDDNRRHAGLDVYNLILWGMPVAENDDGAIA